jgi:hypothetical protein
VHRLGAGRKVQRRYRPGHQECRRRLLRAPAKGDRTSIPLILQFRVLVEHGLHQEHPLGSNARCTNGGTNRENMGILVQQFLNDISYLSGAGPSARGSGGPPFEPVGAVPIISIA